LALPGLRSDETERRTRQVPAFQADVLGPGAEHRLVYAHERAEKLDVVCEARERQGAAPILGVERDAAIALQCATQRGAASVRSDTCTKMISGPIGPRLGRAHTAFAGHCCFACWQRAPLRPSNNPPRP
jgi:hypothetical protein